jgi:DNA invertase Pin-like site-specific DNA recombinase
MIYGYPRVSTVGQANDGNSLQDQINLILERYPTAKIVPETMSGAEERPIFNSLIEKLQKGDTLVVTKLDRFCRSTKEGLEYIDILSGKGVLVHILNMGLIEDTPIGRMIVTNLLAYAEFERAMIMERTMAGKVYKKANDPTYKEGRKEKSVPQFREFFEKTKKGEMTVIECCAELGISRSKWYKMCRDAS